MAVVDVIVRAVALRCHDDAFPGWLDVAITDSQRVDHRVVEKAPVLSSLAITSESAFPFELWLAAEMRGVDGNEVRVALKHGVTTVDDASELVVPADDVVWL